MATNIINPDTLKAAVTELLDGGFVQIGLGFDIALKCDRKKTDSGYELYHRFDIYDGASLSDDVLHVNHGSHYAGSVWYHEEYGTFPLEENLFLARRKMILGTLEEIVRNVLPELFSNRIIEAHERIREIGAQEETWKEVSHNLVGDAETWINCSRKDYDEVYEEEA